MVHAPTIRRVGLRSYHGNYSQVSVTDPLFTEFQCFSDGNQHDFQLLDRTFPCSKFIVTTRRLDDWLISRIRHVEYRRSATATGTMRREYDADPGLAVRRWIQGRLDYHRRVQQYFSGRADDLLIIDICDGADPKQAVLKIAGLLALAAPPGMLLPHENARAENDPAQAGSVRTKKEVRKEIFAAFQELGLGEEFHGSVYP